MAVIKIISNPFLGKIKYQKLKDGVWHDIDENNNECSRLLSQELTCAFFPLVTKQIVDAVCNEYGGEDIKIIFEGTEDEYSDLKEVCNEYYSDSLSIEQSVNFLENARDILDEVVDIFKQVKELVIETIPNDRNEIDRELNKFIDVSNSVIPLCVMGNYSSGKSSFINSLIGAEILPSGDDPVTAKVYEISKSEYDDRAYISFSYLDEEVKIKIEANQFRITRGDKNTPLLEQIINTLNDNSENDFFSRVYHVLQVVNSFEKKDEELISDRIDVSVPFKGHRFASSGNFVIFDTPGSNSASNDKHLAVLREAIAEFSNGLPIYISDFDSLDSTDNEKLCQVIKGMEELDSRFTMIVVNKADAARLPKGDFTQEKIEDILSLNIPRKLYSLGIFYVSSIMGLGSKTQGTFEDEFYSEIYDKEKRNYEDVESKYYKRLYRYNIMPEQLKKHSIEEAEVSKDMIFVNSGLATVESEILSFANKYSYYNKCHQALLFIKKIIAETEIQINKRKAEREIVRDHQEEAMDSDRVKLLGQLNVCQKELEEKAKQLYSTKMETPFIKICNMVSDEPLKLKWLEDSLIEEEEEKRGYSVIESGAKEASDAVLTNFFTNLDYVLKKHQWDEVDIIGKGFVGDIETAKGRYEEQKLLKKEVDSAVADKLIQIVVDEFNVRFEKGRQEMVLESQSYWSEWSWTIRKELAKIVLVLCPSQHDLRLI